MQAVYEFHFESLETKVQAVWKFRPVFACRRNDSPRCRTWFSPAACSCAHLACL